ncbi:YhcH/YjgK/YiaL family protein [Helicobacter cynogastricus]|uniref:YhcH/YjgK/YiaL family protein n=1 Tax=Helicobacter cynogastricus TaxID=329937 RepID=UPI000CF043B3|nr:YhcH/YjgK/YiaL family protein [Helicobacter cynogastricus]
MAVIGKLDTLEHLFRKTRELETLYDYLKNMLTSGHAWHQSLMTQKEGSTKRPLEHGIHAMEIVYQPTQEGVLETHRAYVDFLLVVEGSELILWSDITDLKVQDSYDANIDRQTYHAHSKPCAIPMHAGMLGIFMDYDAHTTRPIDSELVRKVVAKVPKELIKLKL